MSKPTQREQIAAMQEALIFLLDAAEGLTERMEALERATESVAGKIDRATVKMTQIIDRTRQEQDSADWWKAGADDSDDGE